MKRADNEMKERLPKLSMGKAKGKISYLSAMVSRKRDIERKTDTARKAFNMRVWSFITWRI